MKSVLHPDLPILLVDDDEDVSRAVSRTLNMNGYNNIHTLNDSRQVLPFLGNTNPALILLDITMPHLSGDMLLQEIVSSFPHLPVIMATATDSIDMVVGCMKKGAFDYITKPFGTGRLLSSIRSALELRDLRRENEALRRKEQNDSPAHPEFFKEIISESRDMLNIFNYIEMIAPSGQPVLITGETGVGKELAAQAIHRASGRKGRFVAVNVAGLDDEVFADTLFGHARGAFTGANSARDGQIKKAAAGSLFLDEIGDLSLKSQIKLLRLLQEREYLPLGTDTPLLTDARIIVATNRNLERMIDEGTFRKDLYFRLYTHHFALPPLRKRFEDLPKLVPHFVGEASREFRKKKFSIPRELYTLLNNYSFPGNIRELKAMVFNAVSRQQGGAVLGTESFKKSMGFAEKVDKTRKSVDNDANVTFGSQLPSVKEVRNQLISEALKRAEGNISLAARLIGLTRQSLSQYIRNHNISVSTVASE